MQKLQNDLKNERDLRLVTVTVDPERDTVRVLHDYAGKRQADPERWFFLTGKKDDVYALIRDGQILSFLDHVLTELGRAHEALSAVYFGS